ncbi:MAG: DinB family protein [Ignavibacteriales bacterium]|nr:DinB family protein [Ignavibacteriales bacterium]
MEKTITLLTEKDQFLQTFEREYQTTVKVLKAFPSNKLDLKPAEKSRTARDLAWTFVMELGVFEMALKGKIDFSGQTPPAPKTIDEIIATYDKSFKQILNKIKNLVEDNLNTPVAFPVGPKQMMDLRTIDIFWTILMDMIHHRGQMSVYIRIAGGKVPSIYGPTADEPWM